jgi:hypothetical protein
MTLPQGHQVVVWCQKNSTRPLPDAVTPGRRPVHSPFLQDGKQDWMTYRHRDV